ncbi:peptidoglycan-binding protein [Streptomyces griseicoloratus]|uniref:peptidoglycan-binding protein n=1 Tax=Streptomyces griseicoloratus TaxID=2752516 RepID=UPI0028122E5C|nr:peptidoglycan-binding protein [Streptomyces griseicoloratus]
MEQRNGSQEAPGHPCPECGAPRRPDNTPSCACGPRASDALRDARTAQAAAAEDFDPLRIRPYVELDGSGEGAGPASAPTPSAAQDPDATMSLRAVGDRPAGTEAGTEATSVLPTPLAPPAGAPSDHDLRLFETAAAPAGSGPDDTPAGPEPRGRRRGMLLGVAGAVVMVLGAAGYASGLFSYEAPSRDGALPDEVRASVPDPSTGAASQSPAPSTTATRPASASPSASVSASASASPSPSPSPSASSASPTRTSSRPAEPTPSASSTPAGDTATESRDDDHDHDQGGGGGGLRRGDRGPEVTELQQRLQQLYLYTGDANGVYNRQVEDAVRTYQWARGIRSDELGVYGPDTRRMLETETREP